MEKHIESLPKDYELLGPAMDYAEDIHDIFCHAPLLDDWDMAETRMLCNFMVCCSAPRGVVLLTEGETTEYMFFLLTGQVDMSCRERDGAGVAPYVLAPGATVGEVSLIDGAPCDYSYVAVGPVDLVLLTRQAFQDILVTFPRLGNKLLLVFLHSLSGRRRVAWGNGQRQQ